MTISRSKKFLRSTENGRVFPWTDVLVERKDMIECDSSGKPVFEGSAPVIKSELSLREKIAAVRTKDDMIDFGARYDVEFAEGMLLKDMKEALIKELEERGELEPVVDEDNKDEE